MSEIRIVTSGPAQIFQDGVLVGTSPGGSTTPPTYPPADFPAGAPPTADAVFEWTPFPGTQEDKEFTLGQYTQTIRLVVPVDYPIKPGHTGFIKVFGYPGGESPLNSRMIKNNIIQRAWFDASTGLLPILQEDFCIGLPVGGLQMWKGGDVIDYQFKSQNGNTQPVRVTFASPNR